MIQPLRQHRDQAEYADRPWQAGLRHPFSACHLFSSSPLYTDAPSWVLKGTETWLALVCTDVPISAVKSTEGASGDLRTCCNRILLIIALGPAAGPMASPAAQLPALQLRRRPRNSPHFGAATACLLQPASEHLCQEPASLASWLIGTSSIPTTAKLHQADREHAQELHIDAMDVNEEEEHLDHRRPRPVNPRFLTGLSGARRHEPVFAGEVRSRGPPLTRFHPGLAASLPDELFEGLIPGPDTGRVRLTSVDTASTTRAQATPVIEVEDDSPSNRPRAPDVADDAGTETLEGPVVGRHLSLPRVTRALQRPLQLHEVADGFLYSGPQLYNPLISTRTRRLRAARSSP